MHKSHNAVIIRPECVGLVLRARRACARGPRRRTATLRREQLTRTTLSTVQKSTTRTPADFRVTSPDAALTLLAAAREREQKEETPRTHPAIAPGTQQVPCSAPRETPRTRAATDKMASGRSSLIGPSAKLVGDPDWSRAPIG
ncbi:hypothetical protein EYF80_065094 [Liparis tanakae]|uniref:Uncharacterized protein n=1 Tax=Liparis tanakae TaxID=230148 RepID=A0A4Z2E7P5_9TELE|nr:hypothetical protein EYF80_065094 [Liparis tanakae]